MNKYQFNTKKETHNPKKVEGIITKFALLVEELSEEVKELRFEDPRWFKVEIIIDDWFDPD